MAESTDSPDRDEVQRTLSELAHGAPVDTERAFSIVYDELRGIAAAYLGRERKDHTLQATALVHEAYLRLAHRDALDWKDRAHFLALAARAIRRVLIDHARRHDAQKRAGRAHRITLHEDLHLTPRDEVELLALNEALERLAELSRRQSQVVELRFFGGLTMAEIGEVLGVAKRTVEGDWSMAQAWLSFELGEGDPAPG